MAKKKRTKTNTGVAGWRAKGFRAGVGGRHADMYAAWNAQAGKPAKSAPLGKQIDAKESFFEGYLRGLQRREQKERKNAGKTIRRLKKDLRAAGHSQTLRRQVVKTAKGYARSRRLVAAEGRAKKNPALKKVTGSTGWLKADAVRFVKKRGRTEVYIKRAKPRGRKR